jgi:hypothetical protein
MLRNFLRTCSKSGPHSASFVADVRTGQRGEWGWGRRLLHRASLLSLLLVTVSRIESCVDAEELLQIVSD